MVAKLYTSRYIALNEEMTAVLNAQTRTLLNNGQNCQKES